MLAKGYLRRWRPAARARVRHGRCRDAAWAWRRGDGDVGVEEGRWLRRRGGVDGWLCTGEGQGGRGRSDIRPSKDQLLVLFLWRTKQRVWRTLFCAAQK
jgi:hypothetical protein